MNRTTALKAKSLTATAMLVLAFGFLGATAHNLAVADEVSGLPNAFLVDPVLSSGERANVRAQLDAAQALETSGLQGQPAPVRDWVLQPFSEARQAAATGWRWDLQDKTRAVAIRAHVVAMLLPSTPARQADELAQRVAGSLITN